MKLLPVAFFHAAKRHSALEALHFYMFCMIGITLISLISAAILSQLTDSSYASIMGMKMINSVIIVYLGAYIVQAKNLPLIVSVIAIFTAALLSFYINELLGMLIVAALTCTTMRAAL